MRPTLTFVALCALLTLACAAPGSGETDLDEDVGGDVDTEGGNTPLEVVSFETNTNVVEEDGTAVFTAVLRDVDGLDDISGGTLSNPNGGTYGAFVGAGGVYAISVTWDEMNAVESISFSSDEERTFVGTFYDEGGNEATVEGTITLRCDWGQSAQNGRCYFDTGW